MDKYFSINKMIKRRNSCCLKYEFLNKVKLLEKYKTFVHIKVIVDKLVKENKIIRN